jgi:hypothetical protein
MFQIGSLLGQEKLEQLQRELLAIELIRRFGGQ